MTSVRWIVRRVEERAEDLLFEPGGSGDGESVRSPSDLPVNEPLALFGLAAGFLIAEWLVIRQLQHRAWRTAGRQAGLAPEGNGLFGAPDLVGTVDGRSVQARTITQKTGGGGESGSNKTTYTVLEAALRDPVEEGILIAPTGTDESIVAAIGGETPAGDGSAALETETVGEFQAVAGSGPAAREVLTATAREALRKPALLDVVQVGDASETVLKAIPDGQGGLSGMVTGVMKSGIEKKYPSDPGTVRTGTRGLLLEGEELDRQVRAVVAVADGTDAADTQ